MKRWSIGLAICLGAMLLAPCAHGAAGVETDHADCGEAACDPMPPMAGDCDACAVSPLPVAAPLKLAAAGNAPVIHPVGFLDRVPALRVSSRPAHSRPSPPRPPHLQVMDVVRLLI